VIDRGMTLLTTAARVIFLVLLAGLLIARREFAHLNLGDPAIWKWLNSTSPKVASYLFVTETTLLALFPIALLEVRAQFRCSSEISWNRKFTETFGREFYLPLALIAWGALHALVAAFNSGDTYLIFRQSALAMYPIFFIYAVIFFGQSKTQIRVAIWGAIAAAILCAAADTMGWLDPRLDANGRPEYGEWMPIYGQQTLPIAILGLIYFCVTTRSWIARDFAIVGLCLVGWRQGVRPMQSVVPVGILGALGLALFMGLVLAYFKQRGPLKRTALVVAIFAVLGLGFIVLRTANKKPEQPGTEASSEVKAWRLGHYADLFALYNRTEMPTDPALRLTSTRPPMTRVDDPEVHKLQAVFVATSTVSIRNNMWRFLVWKRMASDWSEGHQIVGAGVGKPWFYRALYSTGFHYGNDREGLDPHNSFLNTLYRYGIIGFVLLVAILIATLRATFNALKSSGGDPLLEGLLLYFGYTLVFAFFTVSLEGPPYSAPYWITLGLMYARSRQLVRSVE